MALGAARVRLDMDGSSFELRAPLRRGALESCAVAALARDGAIVLGSLAIEACARVLFGRARGTSEPYESAVRRSPPPMSSIVFDSGETPTAAPSFHPPERAVAASAPAAAPVDLDAAE